MLQTVKIHVLIEVARAARGNTSLESAVSLTKTLRWEIQSLGLRLSKVASDEALSRKCSASSKSRERAETEVRSINGEIRALLDRIEDAVPLINLAITTSGVNLSTTLPQSVSPSRLLQGSTFLTAGDTQYSISPTEPVQVGPTFTLSVYLLFAGHVRAQDEEEVRNTTWKEVIHKAAVKLQRVPMDTVLSDTPTQLPQNHIRENARSDEFAYHLLIVEDLDDGLVHTFDDDDGSKPGYFEGVSMAGIRESIPIHQISKIFYADTGKILDIGSEGENNNPVLLLKRDVNAIPPRRMMDREPEEDDIEKPEDNEDKGDAEPKKGEKEEDVQSQVDAQLLGEESVWTQEEEKTSAEAWRFPPGLDLEWIAFEVYQEPEDSDSETEAEAEAETETEAAEAETESPSTPHSPTAQAQLRKKMTQLHLNDEQGSRSSPSLSTPDERHQQPVVSSPIFNNIRTSLSLLETLLRLTSLQQFQQQSHLSITDELLNFFLEESSTTGAGGDEDHRRHVRAEARRKVGWDPYDESPLKRRGEDYQYNVGESPGGQRNDSGGYDYSSTPQSSRGRGGARPADTPSPVSSPSLRGQQRQDSRRSTELRRQIPTRGSPRPEGDSSSLRRDSTRHTVDDSNR